MNKIMKKILLLLIALFTLAACSSSDDDSTPSSKNVSVEGELVDSMAEILNLNLEDFFDAKAGNFENFKYFIGLKKTDKTLLVGVYNATTGQSSKYNDPESFPNQYDVDFAYGQKETVTCDNTVMPVNFLTIDNNLFLVPSVKYFNDTDLQTGTYRFKVFRYNGNNWKTLDSQQWMSNQFCQWYNNSYAIISRETVEAHYHANIYNLDLGTITSYERGSDYDINSEIPLSYDESIIFLDHSTNNSKTFRYSYEHENRITRYNYTNQEYVWYSIDLLNEYNIANNAIITIKVVSKDNNIWNCNMHVVNEDGTTKDIAFKLNIDDGTIN